MSKEYETKFGDLWEEAKLTSKFLEKLPMKKIDGNRYCVGYPNDSCTETLEETFYLHALIGDAEGAITKVQSKARSIGSLYARFIANGNKIEGRPKLMGLKDLVQESSTFYLEDLNGIKEIIGSSSYDFILIDLTLCHKYKEGLLDVIYCDTPVYLSEYVLSEFIPENIWQKCRQHIAVKVNSLKWCNFLKLDKLFKPYKDNYGTIYVGKFDDGSETKGISGIYGGENILNVSNIGPHSSRDAEIWRIKGYLGLVCYNKKDLIAVKVRLRE